MAESDDLRMFIREILIRFERTMERFERGAEARHEESRRYFEAIRTQQEADRRKLDEILAEGRAGRQALFHLLDQLRGNGGTAPAG